MDKSDYFKLVEENQSLKKTIEFYETQELVLRRELLRERLWRIGFQMDYLRSLSDSTKAELEELEEKKRGRAAESPLHRDG